MTLTDRILGRFGYKRFQPYTPEEIAAMWGSGAIGWIPQTTINNKQEPIGTGFSSLVTQVYSTNPVVFATINARVQLFSEARFQFQTMKEGRPGELHGNPATYLRRLEEPWPGGTTSQLLRDMLLDADLGGMGFVARRPEQLQRLRPDWVTLIAGSPNPKATTWDLDTELLGFGYQPDGPQGGKPIEYLQRSEVAYFAPIRDPARRWAGMPWLIPVLRDISADHASTDHKLKFFENAATPNMAIKYPETMTLQQAEDWKRLFEKEHRGGSNAYKTLFLGGGVDMEVIGANLRQADFTSVQSGGELRIASAGGVPPIIIGIKGGLDSATYSNYGQARRAFADLTMRPLWRDVAGALETITQVPDGSRLWYDDRDISFLQEDVKDAADIGQAQASTIRTLTDAGFDADTVIDAVVAGDFNRLKHTGLFSVQLQPPGTTAPAPAKPAAVPLLNSAREVRCTGCNRLLAEQASPPYRFTCRCNTVTEAQNVFAAPADTSDIDLLRAEIVALRTAKPMEVHNHMPDVHVNVPEIHMEPIHVEVPPTVVNLPEPIINVNLPAPEKRAANDVQKVQVTKMPKRRRTTLREVKRDGMNLIKETLDTSTEEDY